MLNFLAFTDYVMLVLHFHFIEMIYYIAAVTNISRLKESL